MNKKKTALCLIISMLVSSPLYGCTHKVTDKDKDDADQQQTSYTQPFVYYPNSFFTGYKVNNGAKSNVDFYGWHSWVNSTNGVVSPYTSSNQNNIKPTNGGITSGSSGGGGGSIHSYSGVHAGSVAG